MTNREREYDNQRDREYEKMEREIIIQREKEREGM
jgi:hypothetical protein